MNPTPADAETPAPAATKPTLKSRMTALLAEYGKVAIWLYFIIFALVLAGFAIAISAGFEVESAAGSAGLLGAAWLATKVTQPLRILATLALTPVVAKGIQAWKARRARP